MNRQITSLDIDMFWQLEHLKRQSKCVDKQVACIICTRDGDIRASGVNTVIECDKNCHDKINRKCKVEHAEQNAVKKLNRALYRPYKASEEEIVQVYKEELVAYVSLLPCKACQEAILPYVSEIVTFGMIHKDWVSGDKLTVFHHIDYSLIKHNGAERQLSIVQGELAELVTEISDVFARTDKPNSTIESLLDEVVDVELQLNTLLILAHGKDPEAWNKLRAIRARKYAGVLTRIAPHGVNAYRESN